MSSVNRLILDNAEATALDLAERGEKWGAYAIVGLLSIIEDLDESQRNS